MNASTAPAASTRQVLRALEISGQIQSRTSEDGRSDLNIAQVRRALSEAAWALATEAPTGPLSSEVAQMLDAADPATESPVDPLAEAALDLLACKISTNIELARATFQCVVRPLGEYAGLIHKQHAVTVERLPLQSWQDLAGWIATRTGDDPHPLLLEALAGLMRLHNVSAKLGSDEPLLQIGNCGPYVVTGSADVVDHLGRTITCSRPVALCRCGRSRSKPFCDGSHIGAEFTANKDPRRVEDRRDTYRGQVAIVFDNRGLCAHSGFCTDRLNGVFHLGEEPFVTPSGGRLDDIVRAVRRCPSGALSFGMDQREAREQVDQPRSPRIEVSKNGPYRITGSIRLIDDHGAPQEFLAGASKEHYSLCRCGSSLNKPFCSGMHWSVNFVDPPDDPAAEPTLFEWAGGYPALLDMTTIFYGKYVPQDPLIGPLFAEMSPDHPERVASWLSEVFGGPKFYSERYGGYGRMISQHIGKNIKAEQRARWASLMAQSADDAGLPGDPEFRAAFIAYIEWGSRIAIENSAPGVTPPPNLPVPQWWWVCNARPGARPSALAHAESAETPWSPPPPGEAINFQAHIKPLFRAMDRNSMKFAFDLWDEGDVVRHGAAIVSRLESGTMPCDGRWPEAKLATFKAWLAGLQQVVGE